MIRYSKEQISRLEGNITPELQTMVNSLVQRVHDRDKNLSIAEADCACRVMNITYFEKNLSKPAFNLFDFPACEEYLFTFFYLINQMKSIGWKEMHSHGRPLTSNEREQGLNYLDKSYEKFQVTIEKNRHGGMSLINYMASESYSHIQSIENFCKRASIGWRLEESMKRDFVLHSRFILLKVQEYFEELGKTEEIVNIDEIEIKVDGFCFIHTLFEHFAEHLKKHQSAKTYHKDPIINPIELPNLILEILNSYNGLFERTRVKLENFPIFLRINSLPYAIWFKKFKNGDKSGRQFLRVQTFYPVGLEPDLTRIKSLKEVNSNSQGTFKNLSFLI